MNCFADGTVTRPAFICHTILSEHEIRVYRDLSGRQAETEDFVWQRKVISDGIFLRLIVEDGYHCFPRDGFIRRVEKKKR